MNSDFRINSPHRPWLWLTGINAALLLGFSGVADAAPTLGSVAPLPGGIEDTGFLITYASIAANADEADTTAFRLESVTVANGTMSVPVGSLLRSGTGDTWTWTPALNTNGTIPAFSIKATKAAEVSATAVPVSVVVAAVNDPPTITGGIGSSINDNADETSASSAFLSGLTIADVEGSSVTVVVRVSKTAEDVMGDLVFPDATRTESGNNYVYTYASASPATATTRLDAVRFVPIPNLVAPGTARSFSVQVNVEETADNSANAQSSGTVALVSVDDQPAVVLSFSPGSIPDDRESTPFRVTVTDPDIGDETDTVTLTLTETAPVRGTLTIPAGSLTGTRPQVEAGMATVKYRPNAVTAPVTATFTCTVVGSNPVSSSTANLSIIVDNDPPDIAGITTELLRTDDDPLTPAVFPFQTVTISDLDAGQILTATITMDNPGKGAVQYAPADLPLPLTGTASQLTQKIRRTGFKPTANRVAVGQTETTTLTLSVTDGIVSKSNSQTQVATQSVNGAPAITLPPGTVQPRVIAGETSGNPFAGITITDDDAVPQVTVTVTTDNNAKGGFASIAGGFTEQPAGSGIFKFTGAPPAATTALQAMVFTLNPAFSFPASQPGLTTFTIEVTDALQNRSTQVLTIVMRNAARNILVTLREDDSRKRAGSLRHAVENAKDNDVITFAFADYPAVLRLEPSLGPLLFTKHVRLKGPGADLLSISGDSDGNGTPDMQLGKVQATVIMESLTLTQGSAPTGGALHVARNPSSPSNPPGSLTLRYCSVTGCRADQWGGAIDVEEGSLAMEHCLVKGNSTDASFGLGGGAISLYTSEACSFTATTFSGNRQRAAAGFGGGAIYAENFNPQAIFPVALTHCTFSENEDAAHKGTSVLANVFNCRVTTRGSIFADGAQRNLDVAGSGQIFSQGRNISNDATQTTLIQGGQPQSIILLNQTTDKVSTDPLLLPLSAGIGGSQAYPLSPLSPAIDIIPGASIVEGTDQRGVIRGDGKPDSGAVELSARERVIINEIQSDPAAGRFAFIEFYIPRDSGPVDLTNMSLWVNGKLRHTFVAGFPPALQPGFGAILAEGAEPPATTATPVVLTANPFWDSGDDKQRSVIELRAPGATPVTVARADYVSVFVNPVVPGQTFANNSITLAPQFGGSAMVPHSTGKAPPQGPVMGNAGAASSPGADTGNTPFGQDNANPFAAADGLIVSEDDLVTLPVLANDSDADGLDKLVFVDVSTNRSAPVGTPPAGNDATGVSLMGSGVSITPAQVPLRGTELWYDPRTAQNHLPVGVSAADSFYYTIVDIGAGPITAYAVNGTATNITSPAHRLTTGEQITISGSQTAGYNGTFTVTRVDENTFSIPPTFINNPATKGIWTTVGTRQPTQRSENQAAVTVMGRNDAPTPAADTVATNEEQILRIMGDPDLIASAPVFDTDPSYPLPRVFAPTGLLTNDTDPDDDDNTFKKLRIVGVARAKAITSYAGNPGQAPVTVTLPGHGLTSGATVLISGYGGHSSYNNYHAATIVDADTFTIPIAFVDNHAQKGLAGVLTSEGRLTTTSELGAAVTLEIRNSRLETNIIYNPRASAQLNMLSRNEPAADSFYYVAEDSHGAGAFAKVTVNVTGVNDSPVPANDPGSLSGLNELVTGGTPIRDVLSGAKVLYSVPSATAGRGTVTLRAGGSDYVLTGVPQTNEDTALSIPAAELLGNDTDIDHLDTLRITLAAGQNVSREGGAVSLAGGGASVLYDPAVSPRLNALAREERVIDTIAIDISDNTTAVTAIVAIEVTGRNDRPTALADTATIPEDQLLTLPPPGVLLNDRDPDQDTRVPDNRKVLIPAPDVATTVYGARINATIAGAEGGIDSFEAVAGNPALTKVNAPAHGLNTGEEIIIAGTAVEAYNGQFPITRIDDNAFSVPVPSAAGAATAGGGTWSSLRSLLSYDPRGSVFNGSPAGTMFTLDGLAQGQFYVDTWTYTMFDGSYVFANDDIFRVEADSANVVLDVSANDVNLTGLTGALTIVSIGTPSQRGAAGIGGSNTIVYSPETSFVGDEFFTYTVRDEHGNTDTALVTVRVTVEQLNGNLQANSDAFTVAKGQAPLLNVLANDDIVPATGAALSITRISTAPNAGGTAVIEGNSIRYTPAANAASYPYPESFAYEITGGGTARAIASVAIMVANREGTLPLRPDAVSVQAGSSNNSLSVLANDNILPGSGLDLTILSPGTTPNGSVQVSADQKRLLFTPNAGFIGTASFTYTAGDGLGGTGTANVSVAVGALTTNNDFFTVSSATATPATLDVLANDRVLGSPGTVSIKPMAAVSTPLGTLTVSAGGQTLTFTPVAGQTGERIFSYTIQDGTGREATGSLTVFVTGPGLRANSDFFTVQAGTQSSELNVLLNDAQIPDLGLPKTIVSIGTGSDAPDHGGAASVNGTSDRILYTPAEGFTGEERFTYRVTNGDAVAVSQVIVRVSDGTLFASDDAFSVFRGSTDMRLEVLANDRIIPSAGQTLSITGIGIVQNAPGQQGTVSVAEDGGALLYTPNAANAVYPYTESFTYEISDGTARRAQGTVRVEVLNRAGAREMETNDDAFTVLAGGQNILLAVLANDDIRPAAATGWTITDTGVPGQGGGAVVAGPAISYTPRAGFVGTETFAYTVSDGLGGTGTATVTVKVGDISVSDDVFTVLSGSSDTPLNVFANDGTFPDGFPDRTGIPGLSGFTLATAPAMTPNRGGTATVSGDMIVYRPAAGFFGEESFTYRVQDDSGVTFPGKVTVNVEPAGFDRASALLIVTVTGVNDPPVFVNPAASVTDDRTEIHPFANATVLDVDDQRTQRVTLRIAWPAAQGTLSGGFTVVSPGIIEFSGQPAELTSALRGLTFTPVNNRITVGTTEETVFSISMNDGFVPSPVVVDGNKTTVTPVNDAPQITGTLAGQLLYQKSTLQPFIGVNITDADNQGQQSLQVSVQIDNPAKGFLSGPGGFVQQPAGSGIYTISGTPANVAAGLRALVFEPTPAGRVTPSQSETSTFTITVNDGFTAEVVDATTTITVLHAEVDRILPLNASGQDASQAGAEFGAGIALSGDTLVIGSSRRDTPAVDGGQVFVYERNAGLGLPWGQVAVLTPTDLRAGDRFGFSVAIDGDIIVVGAPFCEVTGGPSNAGAIYIFGRDPANRNAWNQLARLTPSVANGGGNDNFGWSVAVHGTTVLAGAPGTALSGENEAGRVHVFEQNQGGPNAFGFTQSLTATGGRGGDHFGFSLAVDANTAVAGAAGASRNPNDSSREMGAAYVLERTGPGNPWTVGKKLSNFDDPESRASDQFGFSVDVDGDTILIGAARFDAVVSGNRRENAGAAFIFERNPGGAGQWALATKLVSPDAIAFDNYGWSVALDGDLCLIGSPRENTVGVVNGFMDVRRRNSGGTGIWGIIDHLSPGQANAVDRFGQTVALDEFTGAAGAIDDLASAGSARAYQFQYDAGPQQALLIADQRAPENQAFGFTIPSGTFGDPDYGGSLNYLATLEDGSPLPPGGWLSFNPATATFSGTPVPANNTDYRLVVHAINPFGTRMASNAFSVEVVLDPARALQRIYAEWSATRFPPATLADPALEATVWGPLANPDGDSAANLIEMLYGTLPQQREPSPLTITKRSDGPQVSVTFPRPDRLPMEFIHVEWSDSMASWLRQNVSYTALTDLQNREWITATVYPESPEQAIFVRIAVGP